MEYSFRPLEQKDAEMIVSWDYPEDYMFADISKGSENRYYLLNEKLRGDRYYAIDSDNELIGYFSLNNIIRKEYGALQLLIKDDKEEKECEKITDLVCKYIKDRYPSCEFINVSTYSNLDRAIKFYERCGFENKGPVSAQGHDMSAYEQEGFDPDNAVDSNICLVILSRKIS